MKLKDYAYSRVSGNMEWRSSTTDGFVQQAVSHFLSFLSLFFHFNINTDITRMTVRAEQCSIFLTSLDSGKHQISAGERLFSGISQRSLVPKTGGNSLKQTYVFKGKGPGGDY